MFGYLQFGHIAAICVTIDDIGVVNVKKEVTSSKSQEAKTQLVRTPNVRTPLYIIIHKKEPRMDSCGACGVCRSI